MKIYLNHAVFAGSWSSVKEIIGNVLTEIEKRGERMSNIDPKRLLYSGTQIVKLDKCYEGKLILDIGDGGEGIIGYLQQDMVSG